MFNEYEKLRMRQNPMLQPRAQAGGRSMPAWFSSTLVHQPHLTGPSPPPPPVPAEPPPEESDYEEIDHLPKNPMKKSSSRRACSLCGNPNPAVSCDMCNNQIFCGSCNDMYHRHPKRQHHSRKILEPVDRPPLPPKTPVPHEMMVFQQAQLPPLPPHPASQQQAVPQPVPPPRRKGRFGMRTPISPTSGRKSSFFDPVGTLKRFVGGMAQRPLPSPPKAPPPLPPKSDLVRSMTPTFGSQTLGNRRLSSPQPVAFGQEMNGQRGGIPMTVLEMQNARHHSISVANLSGHTSSRDSGYPDWEEDDEDFFSRNRAHSVSGRVLGRYPSTSQDASHFATLHRPGRPRQQQQSQPQQNHDAPERPPPPLPPRQFPSQTQLNFQNSQSAFDLDRMAAAQQQQTFGVQPWNYPAPGYPFEFQQAMMMGYPGGGTMHRTPSTQSMGPTMNPSQNQPQFFGWGPMGFGPPMTPMEMEMMAAHHRRGSEQFMNVLPPHQQQAPPQPRGVALSNPVTPQGSFRKKSARHMSVEPELTRRLERVDLNQNRRSGTPSSFVRVPPSTAAPIPPGVVSSSTSRSKPPAKPPSAEQSPDDSYFSAEHQQLTESTASSESTPELTESPEGPWECEHCTFINPKSTKVCTICCKTPSGGYHPMKGKGKAKAKVKKSDSTASSTSKRGVRDSSRESSAMSTEEVPVLKSKMSISREKQQTKINLVSQVEKERVKPSKSSLKPGSSGTLKAGAVPPGHKVASAVNSKKVKSKKQQKQVESDDEEENDDDEEEKVASEEKEEDDDEEEEEEEEEDENDEEDEDDADDEENGVVDVKMIAGSSKITRMPAPKPKSKAAAAPPATRKTVKGRSAGATRTLVDSNEDVYGSVPIQTMTISPKIEIRRSSKSKVSSGVGTSPPKHHEIEISKSTKVSSSTSPPPSPTPEEPQKEFIDKTEKSEKSCKRKSSKSSSTEPSDNTKATGGNSPELKEVPKEVENIAPSSVETSTSTKTRRHSLSTGMQTGKSTSSDSTSSSPFQGRKEIESGLASGGGEITQRKSSVGTSPPPQSISTQTYDDTPVEITPLSGHKSSSKQTLLSGDEYEPPRQIEMSEKAMRYARKARNKEQHHQKLKRSMSTHLTYPSAEAWMDPGEGRHLYRSSSRQSLMSDTRSLPMSGPPSRESSPTPMRGGGSRWYDDFRRMPPPAWDRFPVSGDFFASIDDLMSRRRRESMRSQEFELTRMLKDAEDCNFSPEDVQVAVRMCGDRNPIKWLQENWSSMVETVQTLATKYGREKGSDLNDVGTVSSEEAKETLRVNRGNVWAAVTECVEQRRKKFHELQSRGTFLRDDVLTALTANHGNLEAAYVELSKAQLKPFLMRIWGSPTGLDNESAAPTSTSSVSAEATEHQPAVTSERSGSLTSTQPETNKTMEETIERKLSLDRVASSSEPKLEKLVSNAEKVTQEIERAIQELRSSGALNEKIIDELEVSLLKNSGGQEPIQAPSQNPVSDEKEPSQEKTASAPENSPDVGEPTGSSVLQRQKSESESEHSFFAAVNQVKSDGEDESFADAVSEAASNANSPPPTQPLMESGNEILEDDEALLEDEFDDDVLEIEIDDTEANISEFIQNYEILPAKETPMAGEDEDAEVHQDENVEEGPLENLVEADTPVGTEEGEDQEKQTGNGGEAPITKVEIEQLLTTLTSTFSTMEQFATKIKENIATEIQQQLAAAKTQTKSKASHDHSEDGSYEPIALPPGIEENVNKKVAKYQRLAAKKKEKVGRHKSPETRAFQFGMIKEPSASPSPSTSLARLVDDSQVVLAEEVPKEPEVEILEEAKVPEEFIEQVDLTAQDHEQIVVITDTGRYSDYEEVEIDQEDENDSENGKLDANPENEEDEEDDDNGEGEFVEEDINESSIVEESDEDEMLEGEEELEEEDEQLLKELILGGDEDDQNVEDNPNEEEINDGEEAYVNVEISLRASNITPSDTDKVIVTGAGAAAVAKTIRINSSNNNNAVVIVAEEVDVQANNEKNLQVEDVVEADGKTDPITGVNTEETPAQRLTKEGKADTLEQAELALQLIDMNFNEEDSFFAAKECSSLYSALSYLQQECDLCTGKFCAREMVSMLRCTHLCCRSCARDYFTVQVRDKTIVDATCPFCTEPSTLSDDQDLAEEYFNHLDILLKNLLDSKYHEMFQRKLRDWTLAKTPNFKWCSKCSSGFIMEPLQTRLVCPDCSAVTCAVCMEPWDKTNHDHRDNASSLKLCDVAPNSIIEYLNANHIECPRCHFRFSLARGGCMHLTCTQCHHEFCSGCAAPFRMGDKCEAKFPICDKLGLHAHHPRNCLFYLRDKEPDVLSKLLEENAIPYFKENSGVEQLATRTPASEEDGSSNNDGNASKARPGARICQVPIQKETGDGFADDICGKEAPEGYATVCKAHYIEYLGLLIWQNHLDPITILTNDDLEVIVRRAFKKHPGRPNWLSDDGFRKRLLKVINDEIPL